MKSSLQHSEQYQKLKQEAGPQKVKRKVAVSKKQFILISLTTMTVLAAIAVAVAITLYCFKHKRHSHGVPTSPDAAEMYQHGAVAADDVTCSEIGRDILKLNGSAVDAAIATLFCCGIFSMHSTGMGGGGLMLVYKRRDNSIEAFDYRETAPGKAREDMFMDDGNKSRTGGLAVAVPGEVRGMYEVWKKYGKLPWKKLLQPSINLTINGFRVTQTLYEAAHRHSNVIEKDPGLRKLLFRNGKIVELGIKIKNPALASTLKRIQVNPEDFYTGSLAEDIVKDVRDAGGIITLDDLANYKVIKRKVLVDEIGDLTIYTLPIPTGGPVITEIINILKGYGFNQEHLKDKDKAILTYHRFIEAFKFGFASKTKFGDPDFMDKDTVDKMMDDMTSAKYGSTLRQKISDEGTQDDPAYYGAQFAPPSDRGTSHVSVYAPNGDAVSATHSINDRFGAVYRSPNLGIIYNNDMDDFSTPGIATRFGFPPTPYNYIHPGKRPVSSMAPFILVDKYGKVKMVLGCSGGPKIITAAVFVMAYKVWFGDEVGQAVLHPRIHHPLVPNIVEYETERPIQDYILNGLKKLGHNVTDINMPESSACQIICYEGPGKLLAKSDPRKYGHSAGY